MAKKTISQALKDLFLGLGGDSSALADNTSASDYIQDLESAIKGMIPENELPTPEAADIGKVVSVVSDGESGAEYSLETPASGGGDDVKTERVLSVTVTGSSVQSILINELTRADIINFVTPPANTVKFNKTNICAFVIYMSSDYSTVVQGELFLTGVYSEGNNNLPIFSGIMPAGNSSGDLYQMYYMMGATAAGDRFELIPLTTT